MIEQGDDSADAEDRQHGAESDAYEVTGEEQADRNRDADVAQVEAVLRKADRFTDAVSDRLDDAIAGIRDDPHIQ